jgi:hypothetical protein
MPSGAVRPQWYSQRGEDVAERGLEAELTVDAPRGRRGLAEGRTENDDYRMFVAADAAPFAPHGRDLPIDRRRADRC